MNFLAVKMYGEVAVALIKELFSSRWLPPFNVGSKLVFVTDRVLQLIIVTQDDGMRKVVDEIKRLHSTIESTLR